MNIKKTALLLTLCFCITLVKAQINFVSNTPWKAILQQAKAENKLVFVDMYTVWCGPCKVMDAKVFPLPQVVKVYNASFINFKIDAEKGEGIALRKQYAVITYPNYLFVDGDGTLIYRTGGSMEADEFIQEAKNALSEAKQEQTIVQMQAQYASRKNDKVFMLQYLERLNGLRLPVNSMLDDYVAMLSPAEQASPQTLKLIATAGDHFHRNLQLGIAFNVLKANVKIYEELKAKREIGRDDFDFIQKDAVQLTLKNAIVQKNEQLFARVLEQAASVQANPFDNKQTLAIDYYFKTKNYPKYKQAASAYINNYLLKLPADTLVKWDTAIYEEEKAALEKKNDPKDDIPAILSGLKHSQSMQLIRQLRYTSEDMMTIPLTAAETQQVKQWMALAVKITNTDPEYYKQVHLFYKRVYAMALYKANEKQAAIKQMQAVIATLPPDDEEGKKGFNDLLLKMQENKVL